MTNITNLIYDPSPGTTPSNGAIIRTDMYNAIADLLNGLSSQNYNLVQSIVTKTTSYSMTVFDFQVMADGTSGAFTVTLPDSTVLGISKKIVMIKKIDSSANAIAIQGTSSQTIDGATTLNLTQQNETVVLQSDSTNWRVIARHLGKRIDQLEISPVLRTCLALDAPSAPVGSASEFIARLSAPSGTVGFVTTAQSGDFVGIKFDQSTLTNPSSGTITNASTLKIVGAPIASTNVTITNAYAFWVAGGTTLLQATTVAGTLTMSSADIMLAGNKIKTTSFNWSESTIKDPNSHVGILLQSSVTNGYTDFALAPNGTGIGSYGILYRTSDVTTNSEMMIMGYDLQTTGEFDFDSYKTGTGTLRPIAFYMLNTKLLSFDTANTITMYVTPTVSMTAGSNINTASFLTSSMSNGNNTFVTIGQDLSANNCAVIGFQQAASNKIIGVTFYGSALGLTGITLFSSGGMILGNPTGGDKGAGTLNVPTGIYLNGTAYTNPDYVFEKYYTGSIVKFAENDGAKDYQGLKTISDLENYVKTNYKFPIMADDKMDLFRKVDKMLLISEELALYLFNHEKRLKALEVVN